MPTNPPPIDPRNPPDPLHQENRDTRPEDAQETAVPDDAGKLYALRKSKAAVGDSGEFQVVRPDVCIACLLTYLQLSTILQFWQRFRCRYTTRPCLYSSRPTQFHSTTTTH